MNPKLKIAVAAVAIGMASLAFSQVTFYEHENFRGRTFAADRQVNNFARSGFSDRSSSAIVANSRWQVCDDVRFGGRCVVLRPGTYNSLEGMGMNKRISSARPINDRRQDHVMPQPNTMPVYEYRRRPNERVFNARVTTVRTVVGPPNERCWMEPDRVNSTAPNVGGAVVGALLGGVLGHQVGGGVGKDLATAGGAVAGGVMGSNMGRNSGVVPDRLERRCETTASTTPAYWDVGYNFRGLAHHVQMTQAPGPTIEVNARGEPRQ